jgi:7-cyano-7-deazaguanine synthase in queuosine biosynthesis
MDTTDPQIRFYDEGGCSHCVSAQSRAKGFIAGRQESLKRMLELLGAHNQSAGYDSIIGVSGGIDSSVCMEWAAEHELRPLIVHVDAGWNTETAVRNVETLCTAFGFDLETVVIDWEQMRGLQVAFLRSGIANQDIPQDHVFLAALYAIAMKFDIKNVIEGRNWQTESILPIAWGHSARDTVHLRAVARRFGGASIDRLPIMPGWRQRVFALWIKGMRVLTPLHFLPYDKEQAKRRLIERYG